MNTENTITVLGKTFNSEEERRTYFREELRKHLPELKKMEGFPIGEDEDILNLSDPPYYTACPNPWLNDFIAEWEEEKKKLETQGMRRADFEVTEPYAADVSEGKNHPIFSAHTYFTKVPHAAIMRFILHYTQPGDTVFDGFAGTGMTGVAAQLCETPNNSVKHLIANNNKSIKWGKRNAICIDLSPLAGLITLRLEKLDLRSFWKKEDTDFTPWLAREENIQLLSETIGLELEVKGQEENVGPFRADILCIDTTDNHFVLIENQLERTDHCHLGQLMTYAAGLDVVTVIWIAQRFTEEHRATLDWLNRITDNSINFFGIEIELYRINESVPAPMFNIVSMDAISPELIWDKMEGKKSSTVILKTSGDFTLKKDWPNQHNWFKEYLEKYHKFFKPLVKKV